MPLRVKLDEDLPRQMIERFTARGIEATSVFSQGWQGMPDDELWPRVQAERCWLVTADRGFADLRRLVPGTQSGVLVLRVEPESRRGYLELAERVLEILDLASIPAAIVIASPAGIRVRRP